MTGRLRTAALYAVSHFLVDFFCAALLFGRVYGTADWALGALLYNFFAFAVQMPLGFLADRLDRNRLLAAAGCALVAAAFLPKLPALLLCAAAGLGNAAFHVGGGVDILNLSGEKAGLLGVFVSPGAFGVFFGALLGRQHALPGLLPLLLLLAAGCILLWCRAPKNAPTDVPAQGRVWAAAALLFSVVLLRSYGGFLFSFPWKTGLWAVLFVCGTALGKALGGVLADRFGLRRTALCSLGLCAALFLFSENPVCGTAAVLLFNMTMPLTLRLAADTFPGAKGFSFGLLTFALFCGFALSWLGLAPAGTGPVYAAVALGSAALLLPALKKP